MLVVKSDRISILPITNKNKLISLNNYFDKILITKNLISKQLNKDKAFQNLLFSNKKEDSKLLLAYCNKLNYPILSAWELQKFVNADFIDKEKNRIEQFFVQYFQYINNNIYLNVKYIRNTYSFLHLKSGPEGIEPSTRSFGDSRSTTELRSYFFCPNNKPDSV